MGTAKSTSWMEMPGSPIHYFSRGILKDTDKFLLVGTNEDPICREQAFIFDIKKNQWLQTKLQFEHTVNVAYMFTLRESQLFLHAWKYKAYLVDLTKHFDTTLNFEHMKPNESYALMNNELYKINTNTLPVPSWNDRPGDYHYTTAGMIYIKRLKQLILIGGWKNKMGQDYSLEGCIWSYTYSFPYRTWTMHMSSMCLSPKRVIKTNNEEFILVFGDHIGNENIQSQGIWIIHVDSGTIKKSEIELPFDVIKCDCVAVIQEYTHLSKLLAYGFCKDLSMDIKQLVNMMCGCTVQYLHVILKRLQKSGKHWKIPLHRVLSVFAKT